MDTENLPVDLNTSKKDAFGESVLSETKLESLSKYDLLHLLKETKSQCTTFEIANQKLQESVDNLETALEEQHKRCQVLEEDKSFLRNNIKKASANWFERKAKISESEIETNGEEQTSAENESSSEIDDSEPNKRRRKNCVSVAISEESVKLFSDLKFREEQFELSERRCAELNKRVKEYEKVIDDQEIIIHGLEKQLETYFNDNQSMSRQLADLHKLFVDLEAINVKQVNTPATNQEVESSSEHLPTAQEFKEMSGSVTKTYMKLKELIYEKKSLVTEIERLQTLNIELQNRVSQQETRLIRVSDALQTTWLLVSNLKDQHEKIHTSKTILRYELREKREILEHLKSELECSREQWHIIRQKNSEAEREWTNLRNELNERRELKKLAEINGNQTLTVEEVENAIGGRKKSENEFEPPIDLLVDMGIEYGVVNADDEESDTVVALIDGEDVHEHRLQNLEEQCCFLYQKLMTSTSRALTLASRLSSIHQHYATMSDDDDDDEDNDQEYDDEDEDDINLYESEMASPDSESYDTAYVSEGDGAESTSGTTETTVIINENDSELTEIPGEDDVDSDDNADSLSRRLITFLPRKIEILRAENKKLEEKLQVQQEEKGKIESALAAAIEFERRQRRQLEEQLSHLGKCVDELKLERNGKIAIVEEELRKKVEQVEKEEKEHVQLREEYEALKENFDHRGELLQLTGSQLEQTVKKSEERVALLQEEIFNLKNKILEEALETTYSQSGDQDGGPTSSSSNEREANRSCEDDFVTETCIASKTTLPDPVSIFPAIEMEGESHFKRMVILTNTRLRVPFFLPVNCVLRWSFTVLSKEIRFSILFTESDSLRRNSTAEVLSEAQSSLSREESDKGPERNHTNIVDRLNIDISKELLTPHIIQSSSFPTTGRIFPRVPGTYSLVFQNNIPETQEVFLKLWLEPSKETSGSTG